MKVSLIVAVYKDIEALDIIVNALKDQTYKNFELIVAEDNDADEMKAYIASIEGIEVKHTFQKDNGIQKARSLNNAILKSSGDYLIFIDGDCVPFKGFIDGHRALAETGKVVTGRRVNLGSRVSRKIRFRKLSVRNIENWYLSYLPQLIVDKATHVEQGFTFNPSGLIYDKIISRRTKSNISLLGCNYSCYKDDMLAIDGYDESYGETAVADDTDVQWRFEALGLRMKSCKLVANVFHLHHGRSFRDLNMDYQLEQIDKMKRKKVSGSYRATIGLTSHTDCNIDSLGEV